jgi:hypothetical protein
MENVLRQSKSLLGKLDKINLWAQRMFVLMLVITTLCSILAPNSAVYAQDEGDLGGFEGKILGIFGNLGKTAIKVMYGLMIILFAVGTVKSGLGAQAAQAFGATGRVSFEMLNLFGGAVIFVFGLLTLPLANMIINKVYDQIVTSDSFDISQPNLPK